MDEAEKAVFGVSERRMTRDLQPIQQVLSDYYDRIDQIVSRGMMRRLGYPPVSSTWTACWMACSRQIF